MKIEAARRLGLTQVQAAIKNVEGDLIRAFSQHLKTGGYLPSLREYEAIFGFVTFCGKVQSVFEAAGSKKGLIVASDSVSLDGSDGALELDEATLKKCLPKLASLGIKIKANAADIVKSKIPGGIAYTSLDYEDGARLAISLIPSYEFL